MRTLMALLACSEGKSNDDSAPTTEADAVADADRDAEIAADRPFVTDGSAYCYHHETGDAFWEWVLQASAGDPQGTPTLENLGRVDVIDPDTAETGATYAMACDTELGLCFGSFREDQDAVLCSLASQWKFQFVVIDEDDNESIPFEVTGFTKGE